MVNYEGIFFDENVVKLIQTLEENKLTNVNDELHCTFKYKPSNDEIFNELVGKEFEVYLIGYGNDGMNSGFEVLLPSELINYYINFDEQSSNKLKTPHITTSLAEVAMAANTKNLNFKKLQQPVKLIGKFGYWIKDEKGEYLSFEPYLNVM